MNAPHAVVDLHAYQGWLFDLDGVLAKTAVVHAAAWKQDFDEFLHREAKRSGTTFAPFDPQGDYERYVDGEPRADGVRNFLNARASNCPRGPTRPARTPRPHSKRPGSPSCSTPASTAAS